MYQLTTPGNVFQLLPKSELKSLILAAFSVLDLYYIEAGDVCAIRQKELRLVTNLVMKTLLHLYRA